jgi:hypothetical protein
MIDRNSPGRCTPISRPTQGLLEPGSESNYTGAMLAQRRWAQFLWGWRYQQAGTPPYRP